MRNGFEETFKTWKLGVNHISKHPLPCYSYFNFEFIFSSSGKVDKKLLREKVISSIKSLLMTK